MTPREKQSGMIYLRETRVKNICDFRWVNLRNHVVIQEIQGCRMKTGGPLSRVTRLTTPFFY